MNRDSNSKPLLAIALPDLRGGGAERMMVNLANEFTHRGYKVDLVLGRTQGKYISDIKKEVNVVGLAAPRPPGYSATGMFPGLVRYLRRKQPAALMSVLTRLNIITAVAGIVANCPTRIVLSERNNLSRRIENAGKRRMQLLPLLAKITYPQADAIVAISEGVADDLAASVGLPREQITVVYNPAYSENIEELAAAPSPHRWFDAGPPVIIGVGSLTKQKDFPTLLRAFARVRERRQARLIILGEGDEQHSLEELARSLGIAEDVEFPGFVDNPFSYMSRASIFVLSSAWEGFGNVIVEALACGTPVVSTDCPSGPREILADGKYGVLVPVGDEEAIANAINDRLDETHDAEVLRNRARQFSVESIADNYLDVLLPEVEETSY